MDKLRVNEIFYSLQGEGFRAGHPSIFIRLSGCDMACGFCDTEFESGKDMTLAEIEEYISRWPCKWIVWTGGEPMLQMTQPIAKWFSDRGFKQAIESNGNHPIPMEINWRVVSPKVAEHVVAKNFPHGVSELRYVRHAGQMAVPKPGTTATHYYLSPMFDGARPNKENVAHCIRLCLENPTWKLSLQTHKIVGVL